MLEQALPAPTEHSRAKWRRLPNNAWLKYRIVLVLGVEAEVEEAEYTLSNKKPN